jgi:hypothetical protein
MLSSPDRGGGRYRRCPPGGFTNGRPATSARITVFIYFVHLFVSDRPLMQSAAIGARTNWQLWQRFD